MAMRYLHYSWLEYGFLEFRQIIAELNAYIDMTKQTEGAEAYDEESSRWN